MVKANMYAVDKGSYLIPYTLILSDDYEKDCADIIKRQGIALTIIDYWKTQ